MVRRKAQRFGAIGIVILTSSLGAADTTEEKNSQDKKSLQGKWEVTKFVDFSEEAAPAEEIKDMTFEFDGNKVSILKSKNAPKQEMKFVLDAGKEPRWIDIDMGDPEEMSLGIYELKKDELTICLLGGTTSKKKPTRPKEFKASKSEIHSLFVLKRIKK
jgi:uncharacterized protein (TIGR03067 family)